MVPKSAVACCISGFSPRRAQSLAGMLLAAALDHAPDPTEVRLLRPGCYPAQARAPPASKGRWCRLEHFRRDSRLLGCESRRFTSNLRG